MKTNWLRPRNIRSIPDIWHEDQTTEIKTREELEEGITT